MNTDKSPGSRARVIIAGAGFAGLEAAKALSDAPVSVTVLDRQNHHCFQPLLYQVATAALSPADVAWPVRSILARQSNARVYKADVVGVDTSARKVFASGLPALEYDFLILATGATHSYFGHDEWAQYAPGLKNVADATDIRRRLLTAFELAEIEPDAERREQLLSFVVIGGGPTGVEMAGAIAEIARNALARDFRRIDPRASKITLIEAGPRILPAFPEHLSAYAEQSLSRMGVSVRTATMVTSCMPDGVMTASGERLPTSMTIWAAGVKASPAGSWLHVELDKSGRVKVNDDLSVPGAPEVFVIGDLASVRWHDRTVPGIAPAAKQMGRFVGLNIAERVAGGREQKVFHYRHAGDLATIGRRAAVVSIGRARLTGWLAWAFWSVAHIFFLIGTRNRVIVATNWLWEYLTFQRGARLILEGPAKTITAGSDACSGASADRPPLPPQRPPHTTAA